jgi:prepilin-type N-terminal cleavage/methylation domain-containing protein
MKIQTVDYRSTRRSDLFSGFTLIELLVVIAVVSIPAALLLPAMWIWLSAPR